MQLIDVLDKCYVVHVRGTPTSGKTILATMLDNRLKAEGRDTVFVQNWPWKEFGHRYKAALVHAALETKLELDPNRLNSYTNVVFIIDEAQKTYRYEDFWQVFIKGRSLSEWGSKICLFSSYGNPVTGSLDHSEGSAPVHFGPQQRVGITPSLVPFGTRFGLFFTADEFEDVVDRHNKNHLNPLPLDAGAKAYLYKITNGHPGAVTALLTVWKEV